MLLKLFYKWTILIWTVYINYCGELYRLIAGSPTQVLSRHFFVAMGIFSIDFEIADWSLQQHDKSDERERN